MGNLALFKDDDEESTGGGGASFISGYTTPGPKERATSAKKKVFLLFFIKLTYAIKQINYLQIFRQIWALCLEYTFQQFNTFLVLQCSFVFFGLSVLLVFGIQ